MPQFSMVPQRAPARWADLVKRGGYLSPQQRHAFEQTIKLVNDCLHLVLTQKNLPYQGTFEFDAFVDLLEQDFFRHADLHAGNGLRSDVAQTTFWIVRKMADHLIDVRRAAQQLT